MKLSFFLGSADQAGCACYADTAQGGGGIPATVPRYEGCPHETAVLSRCYHSVLDAALSGGFDSVAIPTLGAEGGWPPQFAVPAALVAVERWRRAHPETAPDVTLCAPDRRTYDLYEEFAVTEGDAPITGSVVVFFMNTALTVGSATGIRRCSPWTASPTLTLSSISCGTRLCAAATRPLPPR